MKVPIIAYRLISAVSIGSGGSVLICENRSVKNKYYLHTSYQ